MFTHLRGKKPIVTIVLTLSAATCLSAFAEESNKDTPIFGDPRGSGVTQLALGGAELLSADQLLVSAMKDAPIPAALKGELNASSAELKVKNALLSPEYKEKLIKENMGLISKNNGILKAMGNQSSIRIPDFSLVYSRKGDVQIYTYSKSDLERSNQLAQKRIETLKASSTISAIEKQSLVSEAAGKLAIAREKLLKFNGKQFFIKSVKRVAGGLLIIDVINRAYIWFADESVGQMNSADSSAVFRGDRKPAISPKVSPEADKMSSANALNGGVAN